MVARYASSSPTRVPRRDMVMAPIPARTTLNLPVTRPVGWSYRRALLPPGGRWVPHGNDDGGQPPGPQGDAGATRGRAGRQRVDDQDIPRVFIHGTYPLCRKADSGIIPRQAGRVTGAPRHPPHYGTMMGGDGTRRPEAAARYDKFLIRGPGEPRQGSRKRRVESRPSGPAAGACFVRAAQGVMITPPVGPRNHGVTEIREEIAQVERPRMAIQGLATTQSSHRTSVCSSTSSVACSCLSGG